MKYVVFYKSAADMLPKARLHFAAHQALYGRFVDDGTLLMMGTFANPQEEGSMGIFTTREAAEEFVREDPFVLNGVVRNWHIREWNEVLWKPSA
ncbi:MAG TPA: YciI family protein [Candidatus Acidoferrales bacterium]|nr:YciI family protein [Candidatus Acidoferrales bacterium]